MHLNFHAFRKIIMLMCCPHFYCHEVILATSSGLFFPVFPSQQPDAHLVQSWGWARLYSPQEVFQPSTFSWDLPAMKCFVGMCWFKPILWGAPAVFWQTPLHPFTFLQCVSSSHPTATSYTLYGQCTSQVLILRESISLVHYEGKDKCVQNWWNIPDNKIFRSTMCSF